MKEAARQERLQRGRNRIEGAPAFFFGSLCNEDVECLVYPRGPDWRAARAKILTIDSLDERDLVYGWCDDRGEVRLELGREAFNGQRIPKQTWDSIVEISSRYCHSEATRDEPSDPDELVFTIAYDTRSPRHERVRIPPHPATELAEGATTTRAREGLARLAQMTKLDARLRTFDAFTRVVLPACVEPIASGALQNGGGGFAPGQLQRFGHADPAVEQESLRVVARLLRAAPALPGSRTQLAAQLTEAVFQLRQFYALEQTSSLLSSLAQGMREGDWSLPDLGTFTSAARAETALLETFV